MFLLLQEVVCNVADLVVLCVFLVEKLREFPLKETNSSMFSFSQIDLGYDESMGLHKLQSRSGNQNFDFKLKWESHPYTLR